MMTTHSDEQGMFWWNSLDGDARQLWLWRADRERESPGEHTASVRDAWQCYQRSQRCGAESGVQPAAERLPGRGDAPG